MKDMDNAGGRTQFRGWRFVRLLRPLPPFVVGGLCCGLVPTLIGHNHWPAPVIAGIVGGFLILLVDLVLSIAILLVMRRRMRSLIVTVCAAIGICLGTQFILSPDVAFKKAFGTGVPIGVQEVHAEGYYAWGFPGGPSDNWIWLRFKTDPTTLKTLLAKRDFVRSEGMVPMPGVDESPYLSSPWCNWFRPSVPHRQDPKWRAPPPTDRLEFFKWPGTPSKHIFERAEVLFDMDSGITYVVYMLG